MAMTLEDIRNQMTDEQRRDMAEIVANEVKRRESMKQQNYGAVPAQRSNVRNSRVGNALPKDSLTEMYSDLRGKIQQIRAGQIDEKIAQTKSLAAKVRTGRGPRSFRFGSSTGMLAFGVIALGLLKVGMSSGMIGGKAETLSTAAPIQEAPAAAASLQPPAANEAASPAAALTPDRRLVGWSAAEKQVLTELDARRVELEKRRQELTQKEEELEHQAQAIAERTAELRTLVTTVSQIRKERDNQYEARLEQLSNVYSSMAPNEAAPLVGKLDEETALALLKRMPGKRMGQILSLMDPERAVRLTKTLSEKSDLAELPAR